LHQAPAGCSTIRYADNGAIEVYRGHGLFTYNVIEAVTDAWLSHAIQWRFTMCLRFKDLCVISISRILLAAAAGGAVLATNAFAQSAREVRGASPYVAIENEPAPKLIVDPPLPSGLPHGIFWVQYRVENVRIAQVFGASALNVSPRVGHLHITVDDLPWRWADASGNNTVDIAGLLPGPHKC
jgi:hypothetical protein